MASSASSARNGSRSCGAKSRSRIDSPRSLSTGGERAAILGRTAVEPPGPGCAVASRRLDVTRTEVTVALGTSPSCRTVQRPAGILRRPDRRGHEAGIDGRIVGMRLGIAHHFGWAVAVMASADYEVVDRRRIELIEPGVPMAPIHHEGGPHLLHRSSEPLSDDDLTTLVAEVRASVVRATSAAMDELVASSPEPVVSMSLRAWPADFPNDIATQRRVPYESRADSVMYCQVLAELARERGWVVHLYNAKEVENEAVRILGERAEEVLQGPRAKLGPPWSKDHRMALAATIVASRSRP